MGTSNEQNGRPRYIVGLKAFEELSAIPTNFLTVGEATELQEMGAKMARMIMPTQTIYGLQVRKVSMDELNWHRLTLELLSMRIMKRLEDEKK